MENENQENLENENQVICADCGTIIDESDVQDGNYYHYCNDIICQDCYSEDYFTCEDCCCVEHNDDMVVINVYGYNGNEHYVCQDCADRNYTVCDDCGQYYNACNEGIILANGNNICGHCFANGEYYACADCDEYYHSDDMEYIDEQDEYYCYACADEYRGEHESDQRIYGYHEFNNWQLYKTEKEKKPPFYIGFELETQPKNGHTENQEEALELVYSNLNAICAHDGSLGYGGFEIISHPQTFKYIFENADKMRLVLDKLIELGYSSHDNNECGLHFHVTRPENPEVIDRLWLVMETYKKQIIQLSRRTGGQISHWAQFLSDFQENDSEQLKALYFIKKTDKSRVRYMALNNQNRNTIEFRFFRGTLKSDTFFGCVEFINNLMTLCSNLDINVEAITWDKLCKGKYISKYIQEKNIFADFSPIDKSLEYIKKENKFRELIYKINRLFMQEARRKINETNFAFVNIHSFDEFYKNANEARRFYREISDGLFEKLQVMEQYGQNLNIELYSAKAFGIINSYNFEAGITKKITDQLTTLKKMYSEVA